MNYKLLLSCMLTLSILQACTPHPRDADRKAAPLYFADVTGGEMPGDIAISSIGSTRMACPSALMNFENSYLSALGNVTKYGFSNGRLALAWQQDGVMKTMLFLPVSD